MRFFCTYFDRNYLVKGLCLLRSIFRCHGSDATVYVVCMDEFTRIILRELNLPRIILVPLHSIEQGDERLLMVRPTRSAVEYLWTLTPTIILRLLEMHPEVDILTYIDADMFFFQSSDALYEELGDASILIHEHRFPPSMMHLLEFGRFNVGILAFRRDRLGYEVLNWWRERCLEWCKSILEDGKYGDQKYLDSWPEQFKGVVVTQNIGIGVAPWNHSQYLFREHKGALYLNDTPLMIYHFHAFQILNEAVIVPVGIRDYLTPLSYFYHVLPTYLSELQAATDAVRSVDAVFNFGLLKNDFSLTSELSFVVRRDVFPTLDESIKSLSYQSISPDWTLFPGSRTL